MLKNLLSTLIESVFTNKKRYIASRCLPNGGVVKQTYSSSTGTIVVPFDGWVRVQAKCNGLQVDSYSCIAIVNNQDQQWPSIVLPVSKGSNLVYNVLNGLTGDVSVWFIHNQTNE